MDLNCGLSLAVGVQWPRTGHLYEACQRPAGLVKLAPLSMRAQELFFQVLWEKNYSPLGVSDPFEVVHR